VAYRVDDGGYIDNVPGRTYVDPVEGGPQFDPTNASVVEEDFNDYTLTGGRISALWEVSDEVRLSLAVITEDSETSGTWESDPAYGDFEVVRFFDEYKKDKWTNLAFTVEADLGFATFLSVTSSFDRDIAYEWDNMAYEQYKDSYWGYYYGYVLYNSQYTFGTTFNDQNQKRFSQEFRLTSQSDSKLQWMAGLYYEDLHDDWYYGADNPQMMETVMWPYAQYWAYYYNYYGYQVDYPIAPTTVGYSETLDRDNKQWSVFGEVSYDIGDKWRIIGGARWFKYDRYNFLQNQFPEGLPPWGTMDTDGITIGEGDTSDVLWKGSVQYQATDNAMFYFLFSQGLRLGGFNSLRAANSGSVPLEYDSDTMDNYEMGMKSMWLDGRLKLNMTLFRMEWGDFQQNIGGLEGAWWLTGTYNATDARTTGVELDTTMLFTQNFQMNFNVFYADAKWKDDFWYPWQDPTDPEQEPGILKGQALANSPDWKGFLGLYWTIPGLFNTEDVFVNYTFSFQSETANSLATARDLDPNGFIPSWNVSSLQIGTHLHNNWKINLVVRNLFDQKAISSLSRQDYLYEWFGQDWNRNVRTYNRPRSSGIQVSKDWY
jgi:outer membrane receptor protein involved in Fe transport